MRALVAGWYDDPALGRLTLVVSEDAREGAYVPSEALTLAGTGRVEIEPGGPVSVTAEGRTTSVARARPGVEGVDLRTARDVALARDGGVEPWRVDPEIFASVATVRRDASRTIVEFPGARAIAISAGARGRRHAIALAHETHVDERAATSGLSGVPESVLDRYPAVRAAYRDGPADARSREARARAYRSGASRVTDLSATAAAGVPAGVVVSELTDRSTAALAEAIALGLPVFVDSGAYSARRPGAPPVDFASVCEHYLRLAALVSDPGLLSVVAPDVVRDREGSLGLLAAHRDAVRALVDRGVDVVVPLHRDAPSDEGVPARSFADTYREAARILGTDDFRPAFPCLASAIPEVEIVDFVREARPARLHLLGVASAADLAMRVRRIAAACPGIDVTSDACHFRAGLGRGRPLQNLIDAELEEATHAAVASGRPPEIATARLGGGPTEASLFEAAPVAVDNAASGLDLTEYLHGIYNTPGFLDRDEAEELAARLTSRPFEREAIVFAALADCDVTGERAPEHVARRIAEAASAGVEVQDGASFGAGDHYGAPLGYVLERLAPDEREVDLVVFSMLVERASERFGRGVRADVLAEAERSRELWKPFDESADHPFAAGIGDHYRDERGERVRLSDGAWLTWHERVAWEAAPEREENGVALYLARDTGGESFVTAYGRVARFGAESDAIEAFERYAERGVRSALEAERGRSAPESSDAERTSSATTDRGPIVEEAESGMGGAGSVPRRRADAPKIEDFGEVLHGARKHYAAAYRERLAFAAESDVALEPLSKSWPEPDYARLLEGGTDRWVVATIRAIRDEVPAKPQASWKLDRWAEAARALRELACDVLEDKVSRARFEAKLAESRFAGLRAHLGGRIELYERAGHTRSLKGLRLRQRSFASYRGERFSPDRVMWVVERGPGAPAKQWPYTISASEDKEVAIAGLLEACARLERGPKRAATFEIWRYPDREGVFVGKKVGRTYLELARFDDVASARAYRADHHAELVASFERRRQIPDERREANEARVGPDRRAGGGVTPEAFGDAFGFRGVQFGNYVEGARRQADLDNAFDALEDLADVLGVSSRSLSLGGELGLAFGARGTGGRRPAAAHYETSHVVINLTKNRGAGSLAHEWFHALDNAVSRASGRRDGFATERSDLLGAGVAPETVAAFAALTSAIRATGHVARSRALDLRRTSEYWSTGRELAARAFERYVIARLEERGASNDYLANIVSKESWDALEGLAGNADKSTYPYPTDVEMETLRAAFDGFVASVRWPGREPRPAQEVVPVTHGPAPAPHAASVEPVPSASAGRAPALGVTEEATVAAPSALVVVPCGSAKVWDKDPDRGAVAARDAYTGNLFRANRAYAEGIGARWVILSAKYGFLDPGTPISGPYDVSFNRPSSGPVDEATLSRQAEGLGLTAYDRVVALGGLEYRARVSEVFGAARVESPFVGLGIGELVAAVQRATLSREPEAPPMVSDMKTEQTDRFGDGAADARTASEPAEAHMAPLVGRDTVTSPAPRPLGDERAAPARAGVLDGERSSGTPQATAREPRVDVQIGEHVRFMPREDGGAAVAGVVLDRIVGDDGAIGYELHTPADDDPGRSTRVWERDGAIRGESGSDTADRSAIPRPPASAADLAADYMARGLSRDAAYAQYLIDRALRPEIDRAGFAALYDAAQTAPVHSATRDEAIREASAPATTAPDEDTEPARVLARLPEPNRAFEVLLPGGVVDEYVVLGVEDGHVTLGRADSEHAEQHVPLASFDQFYDDLRAVVRVSSTSGDRAVDALARGEAEYLGKGDDGISFRVGDELVKVSTLVPYVPFNRLVHTPESAMARLAEQCASSEHMRAAGIAGLLPTRFLEHEGKGFAVRAYLEVPDVFASAELDAAQRTLLAMHAAGWSLNDSVQIGTRGGDVFLLDTGKAARLPEDPARRRELVGDDLDALASLYAASRVGYRPLGGSALEREWRTLSNPDLAGRAAKDPARTAVWLDRAAWAREASAAEISAAGADPGVVAARLERLEGSYRAILARLGAPERAASPEPSVSPERTGGAGVLSGPYTLDEHRRIEARVKRGEIGAAELREAFERLLSSEREIKLELGARPIEVLAPGGGREADKDEVVARIFARMCCRYALGRTAVDPARPDLADAVRTELVAIGDADVVRYAASLGRERETGASARAEVATTVTRAGAEAVTLEIPASLRLPTERFERMVAAARREGGNYFSTRGRGRGFRLPSVDAAARVAEIGGLTLPAAAASVDGRDAAAGATTAIAGAQASDRPAAPVEPGDDARLLTRLGDEARARAERLGGRWTDHVEYPHPRVRADALAPLLAVCARAAEASGLVQRLERVAGRAGEEGTIVAVARPDVEDLRALLALSRSNGVGEQRTAALASALAPSNALDRMGVTQARLPGAIAAAEAGLGAPSHEPKARAEAGLEIEVPLGFVLAAKALPSASAGGPEATRIEISTEGGMPVVVAGMRGIEIALAEGRAQAIALVADDALPALRRYEQERERAASTARSGVEAAGPPL